MRSKDDIITKNWINPMDINSAGKIRKNISKMMDEYAKETSIEFFKWNNEKENIFYSKYWGEGANAPAEIYEYLKLTIEERYNLLIKSITDENT